MRVQRDDSAVLLAHGGGGELMRELIRHDILPRLGRNPASALADSAVLDLPPGRVAFTTDSYVVKPLFFPGGDIGRLAVCGTVNDLATAGTRPHALSLALVVEEGFELVDLRRVLGSVGEAAREAGVAVVTGDVKVVERGSADGLFINTAGVGVVDEVTALGAGKVRPGDHVLLTGPIGNHGVAVLSSREGIAFETEVRSDVAPLGELAQAALRAGGDGVRWMRDPTRGGVAAALNELAEESGVEVLIREEGLPIEAGVRAACELLGLDPMVVANEGKLLIVVDENRAEAVLQALADNPLGRRCTDLGEIGTEGTSRVVLRTRTGGQRLVEMPYGEELPRIC
jgi:hydrogenase expression/formation protein HypE